MTSSIAIIGAGSSGLAAAHTLRDAGYTVTIFEQSSSIGGRAATRKRASFIYDHGAQYIKSGAPASVSMITERFRTPDLIHIDKAVWIFDAAGLIQEGDPVQNAEPRWSYRTGLISLMKRMAEGLDIRLETRIDYVQQAPTNWTLFDAAGHSAGQFEQLLITIPTPQVSDLIKASLFIDDIGTSICSHLDVARYNPLLSLALGYQTRPGERPYYALVNTDKKHAISWLAWEHEKSPERVPAGSGLLIAQMAPQYSHDYRQTPAAAVIHDVAKRVAALINEPLPAPSFTDITYWPYALPTVKTDGYALNDLTLPKGLAFCGDAFVGGRVHLAIEHGIIVAQELIRRRNGAHHT